MFKPTALEYIVDSIGLAYNTDVFSIGAFAKTALVKQYVGFHVRLSLNWNT